MKAISVRIRHNSATKHAGQRAHDLRTSKEKLKHVDYDRTPLNSTIIPPKSSAELRKICEARRDAAGTYKRRLKSNASVATDGIITFSKEAQKVIEGLSVEEQNRRFQAAAEAVAEALGTTLEGLIVHRDESAVHAHFTLAAYTLDGKPVSKNTNRKTLSKLQEVAAEAYADLGITRGKPKEQRIADEEPEHKWINRSVQELHNDLPAEIEALRQRIEELTEKEHKAAERLAKTQAKLEQAQGENERLQKRLETYQRRLESVKKELEQAQAEIERLKKLIEPQKPEPIQIEQITGWEETGWGPLKHQEPVLKTIKVITPEDAETALIAARKAAEEEAKHKAEQAVQDELNNLRQRNQELEHNQEQAAHLSEAIKQASDQFGLSSAEPDPDEKLWLREKIPPEIVHYNATLLDYETRLIAVGDGTDLQQAAALYRAAREKGWERAIFWGLNEAQIEWLVKAAEKDGYEIDFKTAEARAIAERVREELAMQQLNRNLDSDHNPEM